MARVQLTHDLDQLVAYAMNKIAYASFSAAIGCNEENEDALGEPNGEY